MARTSQIDFQRVTFSFPKKIVEELRLNIANNEKSRYVASLIEKDLQKKNENNDEFWDDFDDFTVKLSKSFKGNSLNILREIRYGEE